MSETRDPALPTRRLWTMVESRVVLITLGALTVGIGALVLVNDVSPRQYLAIFAWLLGALIVHDVFIAGLVFAAVVIGRKSARRFPSGAITVVQSGLAVAAIVAVVVVPEIVKKAIGTANPSILPLDYGTNLAVFLAALAVVSATAVVLHAWLARQVARRRTSA